MLLVISPKTASVFLEKRFAGAVNSVGCLDRISILGLLLIGVGIFNKDIMLNKFINVNQCINKIFEEFYMK